MILAAQEIQQLTGYIRPSAQIRWLQRHGIRYKVNALGAPVVAIAEFNRVFVGGASNRNQLPDLSDINGPTAKAG